MSVSTLIRQNPICEYDEEGDVMYVLFRAGEPAIGIHVTEHIVLHLEPESKTAVRLTILDFSLLMQPTEAGPRCFPLEGLDELPRALRKTVLQVLLMPPVAHFLKTSLPVPETDERIPLVCLEPSAFSVLA